MSIQTKFQRLIAAVSAAALLMTALVFSLPASAEADALVNLYDRAKAENITIESNKSTLTNLNYFTSDYVAVEPGDKVYLGPCVSGQGYQFATFDSSKGQLDRVKDTACEKIATLPDGGIIIAYTVPAGVGYIRMSVHSKYSSWFLMTRNQPFDPAGFLNYLTYAGGGLSANVYDKSKARLGYPNADHSITASSAHYSTAEIAATPNDTYFFGPCNVSQKYHLYWYNGSTFTQVGAANLMVVDTFENGQVIYAYRFAQNAAGTFTIANGSAYNEFFTIAKNEPLTVQRFYNYWDSQADANLYNSVLDPAGSTHYIAVTEGQTLTFGPVRDTDIGAVYDASYGQLSSLSAGDLTENGSLFDGRKLYTYTAPAGVSYVRINYEAAVSNRFLVLRNRPDYTAEDYNKRFGIAEETVLFEKSAFFVGDSISRGEGDTVMNAAGRPLAWAGRIADRYGMSYRNESVSGASLSTARDPKRIINQLRLGAGQQFDYVIMQGGVNDYSAPTGEISDGFDPANFDVTTYAGALEELFYNAVTLYGDHAALGYIINFQIPGNTKITPHFELGKKICDKWGIAYLDLYNDTELNAAIRPTLGDGVHPNAAGYEILYPIIAKFMMGLEPYSDTGYIDDLADRYMKAASAVNPDYFTEDSYAAFEKAVAAAAQEQDSREKCNALLNAGKLLEQGDTVLPITLVNENIYYQNLKKLGVGSSEEFVAFADAVNGNALADDAAVYQTEDIDLKDYPNTRVGTTEAHAFRAVYDGQNHKITNLKITGTNDRTGLFTCLKGTVRNLVIENADVSANGWSGIAVGNTYGTVSLIENVHIRKSVMRKSGANNGCGILMGEPRNTADSFTIRNCSVSDCTMTVTSTNGRKLNVGFIASKSKEGASLIENCYAYNNTIESDVYLESLGGIVGEAISTTLIACGAYNNNYDAGTYVGEHKYHGELVGLTKTKSLTMTDCYSGSALPNIGATQAYNAGEKQTVTGCYSVQEGTTTDKEIQNGALAKKLGAGWVQKEIPMVAEGLAPFTVTFKSGPQVLAAFYTDWEGKLLAAAEEIEVYGSTWTVNGGSLDVNALLGKVFEADTEVLLGGTLQGDVDHDGKLTTGDVVLLLQYLNGWDVSIDVADADLNGDKRITVYDAVLLLQILS